MKFKEFIGIDLSKESLDVWIYSSGIHKKFCNDVPGFKELMKWLDKQGINTGFVFCLEHTGIYGYKLMHFLLEQNIPYYLVNGHEVKHSLGKQRGKNDRFDAARLAEYAKIHQDKLKPYRLASQKIPELKKLLSYRERLVKDRAKHIYLYKENKRFVPDIKEDDILLTTSKKLVEQFDQYIKEVESQIAQLIESDQKLKKYYDLTTSVKGIGLVAAIFMITTTNCYQNITSPRKYASYSGVAPFEHTSGTSIRGKTRVSHLANKRIKSVLTSAAWSAVKSDPQIRQYYLRKIKEGKNKMLVINNVRNKLISRIFAVAKRETDYAVMGSWSA